MPRAVTADAHIRVRVRGGVSDSPAAVRFNQSSETSMIKDRPNDTATVLKKGSLEPIHWTSIFVLAAALGAPLPFTRLGMQHAL